VKRELADVRIARYQVDYEVAQTTGAAVVNKNEETVNE
jgi:hypothetical protein